MYDRRSLLAALTAGPLLVARRPAWAQQAAHVFRIGVLANHVPREHLELGERSPFGGTAAFVAALRARGWQEGANVRFVWRSAEGQMSRHPGLASELAAMPVDVIVGLDNAIDAAMRATRAIPVVAAGVYGPVEAGYAASLSRPGGNLTGIANSVGMEIQRALALLKEASPAITRVALVAHADYERADQFPLLRPSHPLSIAAKGLGLELFMVTFGDPRSLAELIRSAVRQGANALMIDSNYAIHYHSEHVGGLAREAIRFRLPAMDLALIGATNGLLMSFGMNLTARWQRAAYFVDRILRGEKPAMIPIEQPAKLELHVNLGTAKAIGLEIPPALLLQADQVIR